MPPIPSPSPADRPPAPGDASGSTPVGRVDVRLDAPSAPGYAALVVLTGEHDLATSGVLRSALEPIDGDVLVDLGPCDFMDSTIIGVLLEKLSAAKAAGARLELVVPPGNQAIARITEVVGMRALLTVHDRLPGAA